MKGILQIERCLFKNSRSLWSFSLRLLPSFNSINIEVQLWQGKLWKTVAFLLTGSGTEWRRTPQPEALLKTISLSNKWRSPMSLHVAWSWGKQHNDKIARILIWSSRKSDSHWRPCKTLMYFWQSGKLTHVQVCKVSEEIEMALAIYKWLLNARAFRMHMQMRHHKAPQKVQAGEDL